MKYTHRIRTPWISKSDGVYVDITEFKKENPFFKYLEVGINIRVEADFGNFILEVL